MNEKSGAYGRKGSHLASWRPANGSRPDHRHSQLQVTYRMVGYVIQSTHVRCLASDTQAIDAASGSAM